jgi:hypothetical protein
MDVQTGINSVRNDLLPGLGSFARVFHSRDANECDLGFKTSRIWLCGRAGILAVELSIGAHVCETPSIHNTSETPESKDEATKGRGSRHLGARRADRRCWYRLNKSELMAGKLTRHANHAALGNKGEISALRIILPGAASTS